MKFDEQFIETLETIKRARYPYIWVTTPEEKRCMEMISTVAEKKGQKCYVWDDVVYWKAIKSWLVGVAGDNYAFPDVLNANHIINSFFRSISDDNQNVSVSFYQVHVCQRSWHVLSLPWFFH